MASKSRWDNLQHLQRAKRAAMVAGFPDSREGGRNAKGNGFALRIEHCDQAVFDELVKDIKGRLA